MGSVYKRVCTKLEKVGACKEEFLVLSSDLSPWKCEHFMSTNQNIEGEEMTRLSGKFYTKVFEGKYSEVKNWHKEMEELARSKGKESKRVYFFYTSCPKCIKVFGKNYIVGFVQV